MASGARALALANGERFYTGRPCPKGHPGLRRASFGTCIACEKAISASTAKKRYDRIRAEANRERISEQGRLRYLANVEQRKEAAREWAQQNRAARRAISKSYKARRRQHEEGGDSTAAVREWEHAQPKVCFWCAKPCADAYHVDHFYPLARGGAHAVYNLVIACPTCNTRKGAKHPLAFLAIITAEKQSSSTPLSR